MKTRENFCKSCFWFKSNQVLFAKLFKQKSEKKKEKDLERKRRVVGSTSAWLPKRAHGPLSSSP
jgi:ribosomal protein L44E